MGEVGGRVKGEAEEDSGKDAKGDQITNVCERHGEQKVVGFLHWSRSKHEKQCQDCPNYIKVSY